MMFSSKLVITALALVTFCYAAHETNRRPLVSETETRSDTSSTSVKSVSFALERNTYYPEAADADTSTTNLTDDETTTTEDETNTTTDDCTMSCTDENSCSYTLKKMIFQPLQTLKCERCGPGCKFTGDNEEKLKTELRAHEKYCCGSRSHRFDPSAQTKRDEFRPASQKAAAETAALPINLKVNLPAKNAATKTAPMSFQMPPIMIPIMGNMTKMTAPDHHYNSPNGKTEQIVRSCPHCAGTGNANRDPKGSEKDCAHCNGTRAAKGKGYWPDEE